MLFGDWVQGIKPRWTEKDWLTASDPAVMLAYLGKEASERKRRLFAVACCRRIWDLIPTNLHRNAVELAERYADGMASEEEIQEMLHALERDYDESMWELAGVEDNFERLRQSRYDTISFQETARWTLYRRWDMPWVVSRQAAHLRAGRDEAFDLEHGVGIAAGLSRKEREDKIREWQSCEWKEKEAQSGLLRDIFGNPFRQIDFLPSCLSSKIFELATNIYKEREFGIMANLAGFLKDSGCLQKDILNHCRNPVEHVRGCWVIDLILGKDGLPPPTAFSW